LIWTKMKFILLGMRTEHFEIFGFEFLCVWKEVYW